MHHSTLKKSMLSLATITLLTACNNGDDGINGKDGLNGTNGLDASRNTISLSFVGRYESGQFAQSAAEIVSYDPSTKQAFVVNAQSGKIDILDISAPTAPIKTGTLNVASDVTTAIASITNISQLGAANSVSVHNGVIAVAIEANPKTNNGYVAFYQASDKSFLSAVEVGALPDMLTFTPDGKKVVVVNEGEPNDGYDVDPEGSVSITDVSAGFSGLTQAKVTTASFSDFNVGSSRAAELPTDVRIFGPNASVAQDLEPEYVAVSSDSKTAWVSLQENNAIATIDLTTGKVSKINALGFKNYGVAGNEFDASDKDNAINIRTWPVWGMYQPDSIAVYDFNGKTYVVSANEGDARAYSGFSEEIRVADIVKNGGTINLTSLTNFSFTGLINADNNLGRLRITSTLGWKNDGICSFTKGKPSKCEYNALYAYGGRSFSIWDSTTGKLVFDSGSDFEKITAQRLGANFNSNHEENGGDSRSDDKGPEPEAVTLGKIAGNTYAFVGLERVGGVMVYDITEPENARFVQYINPRDFSAATNSSAAGDLGPEGFKFIKAEDSPNGKPLLMVGNEISGTTSIFQINTIALTK
ncbi:MAG: choice-of-anchor I family protein [Agitococcus sp.]